MSIMPASIGRDMRRLVLVSVPLICSGFAFGQSSPLKGGATVYIEPMGGYETYLAAALMKKNVPLLIATQKEQADYIVTGGAVHHAPGRPAVAVNNTASASINVSGDSPNQQAWNQGWAAGQQRAAASAAAKAAMGYSDVRISIVDAKSTQIVFAYSGEKNGSNQLTKTAEDCAKHLKEFIKKSEKKS
jgi:hypothetical protein